MAQETRSTATQDSPADVRAETLQTAAELLVLRRETLRIIDGAGPSIEASQSESTPEVRVGETEAERVSSPNAPPENSNSAIRERTDMVDQALSAQNGHVTSRDVAGDQKQSSKSAKCTFSGVVPIDLSRFLDSGIALVECPDCASTHPRTAWWSPAVQIS